MKNKKLFQRTKFFGWNSDGSVAVSYCGFNDFSVENSTQNLTRVDNYYTIHFVSDGKGTFYIDNVKYNVKKGDFFILLSGVPISYFPDKTDPWQYYWINFDGPQVKNFLYNVGISPNNAVISCKDYNKTLLMFKKILSPKLNNVSSGFLALSLFYDMLSEFSENKEVKNLLFATDIFEKVHSVVKLSYNKTFFNVNSIAEALYVSHSYLCKKFKEQTGQTVVSYLVNYRLGKACELLATRDYSVKELANSVGFNDEFHFMKVFKKKYSMTIKQYKEDLENKHTKPLLSNKEK